MCACFLCGVAPGKRAQQSNASVRAAFVHVVGDLLQSVSVMVSAIIIYFKVSGSLGPSVQGRPLLDVLRSVTRCCLARSNLKVP